MGQIQLALKGSGLCCAAADTPPYNILVQKQLLNDKIKAIVFGGSVLNGSFSSLGDTIFPTAIVYEKCAEYFDTNGNVNRRIDFSDNAYTIHSVSSDGKLLYIESFSDTGWHSTIMENNGNIVADAVGRLNPVFFPDCSNYLILRSNDVIPDGDDYESPINCIESHGLDGSMLWKVHYDQVDVFSIALFQNNVVIATSDSKISMINEQGKADWVYSIPRHNAKIMNVCLTANSNITCAFITFENYDVEVIILSNNGEVLYSGINYYDTNLSISISSDGKFILGTKRNIAKLLNIETNATILERKLESGFGQETYLSGKYIVQMNVPYFGNATLGNDYFSFHNFEGERLFVIELQRMADPRGFLSQDVFYYVDRNVLSIIRIGP